MIILKNIPGTALEWTEGLSKNAFAVLSPVMSVTKGLTLSQLKELTGLEGYTIQNWVKRGWVERPSGKRYAEQQVVRIILINMLRNAKQLEKIIALMSYINGKVDDRSDDIIPDRELFNLLCSVISQISEISTTDKQQIMTVIENELKDYTGPNSDSKQKLEGALLCMTLGFIASEVKRESDLEFSKLFD